MSGHGPTSVLAISGSERPGGDTDETLDFVGRLLGGLGGKLDIVHLRDLEISGCTQCTNCNWRTDQCDADDDARHLFTKMMDYDALLYATPVHGFGTASLMQQFIERLGVGYLRFERPLANKIGAALVVSRRYSDMAVYEQLISNITLNRMIVPNSGFPAVIRSTDAGPMADDEGVQTVGRMVQRLSQWVRFLRTGNILDLRFPDINEREPRQDFMKIATEVRLRWETKRNRPLDSTNEREVAND